MKSVFFFSRPPLEDSKWLMHDNLPRNSILSLTLKDFVPQMEKYPHAKTQERKKLNVQTAFLESFVLMQKTQQNEHQRKHKKCAMYI